MTPFMPLLFALGIHEALVEVSASLQPTEHLFAYLDDIYVVAAPERIRLIFDLLRECLSRRAGISLNGGKTRIWNRAGICPPGTSDLGPDVWNADGVNILGTPVGNNSFVKERIDKRLADEKLLWDQIPSVPDTQCAFQILAQSAGPRCNHLLRTLPPSQSAEYARAHDQGMSEVLASLLGRDAGQGLQKHIATMPARSGGLGLRSAERTAAPAFWASWADALPMLHARCPRLTQSLIAELGKHRSPSQLVQELVAASGKLSAEGFHLLPSWEDLRDGARPELLELSPEPGEWAHGWQFHASSISEDFFRRRVVLPSCSPAQQATVRSQAGPGSATAILGCPTRPEFLLGPTVFRSLLLSRLQLPLQLTESHCEGCGSALDPTGHHRNACCKSGRLKKRALPLERAAARIRREAGATVRENVKLKDLNLVVPAAVLAFGLPCRAGAQLAIDATFRSPLTATGAARPQAATQNAVVTDSARADKERKYPELPNTHRCQLVVLALETGGRFSSETSSFLEELAFAKAAEAPGPLRKSARLSWQRRWTRLLACTAARAWCSALLAPAHSLVPPDEHGPAPDWHEA